METQPQIPLRTLRNLAEALSPTHLTPRQQARQDRILLIATDLFARFGRGAFSFNRLAQAMRYATSTLRWHFTDMDALLFHIMHHHIDALTRTLMFIPHNAPDRAARLRGAYRAATCAPDGSPTAAHRVFLAERHHLPPEDQELLEAAMRKLTAALPGLDPETMALRDNPAATSTPKTAPEAAKPAPETFRVASARPPLLAGASGTNTAELLESLTDQTATTAQLSHRSSLKAGVAHAHAA